MKGSACLIGSDPLLTSRADWRTVMKLTCPTEDSRLFSDASSCFSSTPAVSRSKGQTIERPFLPRRTSLADPSRASRANDIEHDKTDRRWRGGAWRNVARARETWQRYSLEDDRPPAA